LAHHREAGPPAPGAVSPIGIAPALAARTAQAASRGAGVTAASHAAPRAVQHAFGDRSVATTAISAEVERAAKAPLELALAQSAPIGRRAARSRRPLAPGGSREQSAA